MSTSRQSNQGSLRQQLGKQLRELRERAGKSGHALGVALGCDQSRISRIETGKARASEGEVWQWLIETDAPNDFRETLTSLAEEARDEPFSWRPQNIEGWNVRADDTAAIERAASEILTWQFAAVPELLQTTAYTRHLLQVKHSLSTQSINNRIASLVARQDRAYGTRMEFVIGEHVLRHRFGGARVLGEQLSVIRSKAELPNIDLAILPSDVEMNELYEAGTAIYTSPDGKSSNIALDEGATSRERASVRPDAQICLARFRVYQRHSWRGDQAIDFVEGLARGMNSGIDRTRGRDGE